jgi:DNA-binding NarL/FixJ family response regulator
VIRILLVDDQERFRQGLASLLSLETDLEIVGQASNGQEAIALTEKLQPSVVLMDVRMPICNGVEATREILKCYPWMRILVLTTFDDDEYIYQSLQVGALGYLLKRTPSEQIAAAIRSVHQGFSLLSPAIASKVFTNLKPVNSQQIKYQELLNKRELEVLKLIAQGQNNSEIALKLHLSEGTVKNYVTQILSKLAMRDRIQAALWAQQHLLN